MSENIELTEGFLPLVTEGSILGGKYDTRIPHFPENIGLFALAPDAYKGDRYVRSSRFSEYRIFTKKSDGTHYLKQGLNSQQWSLSGNEGGTGETLASYPNFSGMTIGLGIDLGTMRKEGIESMFRSAGLGEIGRQISEAAGKRGIEALLVTKKFKNSVKLTQQQILDLQNAMWRAKERATKTLLENGGSANGKNYFPKGLLDYSKIYDPLRQILIRCSYGSWKNLLALAKRLKDIETLQGSTETETHILQCDKFLDAMKDYNQDNPPRKGRKPKFTAYGAIALVEKMKATLQAGGTISIKRGPVTVDEIINPNSDLGAWMTDIYKAAKGSRKDFRQELYNKNVQVKLNDKGFKGKNGRPLTVDGDLGANTQHALKAFQTANDLPPTGELTDATVKKLFGSSFGAPTEQEEAPDNTTEETTEDNDQNSDTNHQDHQDNNSSSEEDDTTSRMPSNEELQWLEAYKSAKTSSNRLNGSVGKGGDNDAFDVIVVKAMLARAGYLNDSEIIAQLALLPSNDATLEAAIVKFQKEVGKFKRPDGRVDPDGKTILLLDEAGVEDLDDSNNHDNNNNSEQNDSPSPSNEEAQWLEAYESAKISSNKLNGSVGKGGDNDTFDVIAVKAMLARAGYLNDSEIIAQLALLPSSDATLEAAIVKFQKEVGKFKRPDGRVDPDGKTILLLDEAGVEDLDGSNSRIVDQENSDPQEEQDHDVNDNSDSNNGGMSNLGTNDNDIVLAKGVVQLITEGNIAGGKHDTRRPHYPQNISYFKQVPTGTGAFAIVKADIGVFKQKEGGDYAKGESFSPTQTQNLSLTKGEWTLGTWLSRGRIGSSGVTIGQGFDLGAKYSTGDKAKAKKRLMDADISEDIAERLSVVVGIKGVRASQLASEFRASGMQISQDSVAKLLILTAKDYGKGLNFTDIHPALEDALKAICYAKGTGGAKKRGIETVLNSMRGKSPAQQAAIAAAWMDKNNWKKQTKHTQKLQQAFEDGKNIIMAEEFTLNDLISPDNQLADWVGSITGEDFKTQVATSRAQRYLVDHKFLADTENAVDGQFGSNTEAAVRKFQQEKEIPESGQLDQATLEAMFGPLSSHSESAPITSTSKQQTSNRPTAALAKESLSEKSPFKVADINATEFGCFH